MSDEEKYKLLNSKDYEIERLRSLWETDRQSWNEQMAELTEENERLNKGYCKFKKECDNLPIKCMKEEVVRLNNIINELEKEIKWQRKISLSLNTYGVSVCDILLHKLQELKGSDSNEI